MVKDIIILPVTSSPGGSLRFCFSRSSSYVLAMRRRASSFLRLLFVAFRWKKVVFLVFPTVQAHCRSPTGRSSTVWNAPRPYILLGRRMQRATMGVIYTSVEIAIAMQPATRTWHRRLISRACTRLWLACVAVSIFLARVVACSTAVKVLHSTVATAQLAVHTKTESSGFVGNLIRQRHSRCRILSQNVQLSTNDRAFARRVSSFTCMTWVRSLHTPKSMFFTCPNISHSWKQETPTTTTLNNENKR